MQPSGCILCRPGLHRSFSIVRVYVNFFFLSGKKKKIVLKSKPADKAFALPTQVSKSRLGAHPLRMFFPSLCDLYAWIVRNRITLTHIHRVLTQYLVNVGEGCLGWGNKVGKKTKKNKRTLSKLSRLKFVLYNVFFFSTILHFTIWIARLIFLFNNFYCLNRCNIVLFN